MEDAMQ